MPIDAWPSLEMNSRPVVHKPTTLAWVVMVFLLLLSATFLFQVHRQMLANRSALASSILTYGSPIAAAPPELLGDPTHLHFPEARVGPQVTPLECWWSEWKTAANDVIHDLWSCLRFY